MTVWQRIGELIARLSSETVPALLERLRTAVEGDPTTRRQVAFSVALIALSAKMAKADGVVTTEEVAAFREIFAVPEAEASKVARLYDLARRDVAGFDSYARQVRDLFPDDEAIREDVLDGLLHIARADGFVHRGEVGFLEHVAILLGLDGSALHRLRLRHRAADGDPYAVLEADRGWDEGRLKAQYRALVRRNHPDALQARGVPPEFVAIANARLASINAAWDEVCLERGL